MSQQLFFNKKECLYCGANQTSHTMTWFESTMSVMFVRHTERLMKTKLGQLLYRLADGILHVTLLFWLFLKMARFSIDGSKIKIGRARVLFEEAKRRGIPIEHMLFLGMPTDIFRAKINGKFMYFNGLPRVGAHSQSSLVWIDDKAVLKERLERVGIPVPKGGSASTFRQAKKIFKTLETPVIVKPRLGSRGRHTTTHIYTLDELRHAYRVSKKLCSYVIVEEHLSGPVWRGTVVSGKVVGVLGGEPPRVTGDGVRSILELIREKNENKDSRIKDVRIHALLEQFLGRLGYALETILPEGKTIDLSEKIGLSYGGTSIEVTETTHPKIIEELTRAGTVIGDPILGFDFIIPDVKNDPTNKKWGIIECNAVPFINLHHEPLLGTPQNVASSVWDYVINSSKK